MTPAHDPLFIDDADNVILTYQKSRIIAAARASQKWVNGVVYHDEGPYGSEVSVIIIAGKGKGYYL